MLYNDRELYSELSYSTSDYFPFKSLERLVVNKVPTFNCTNISDAFSVSVNNTEAKLKYPIGLLSVPEINLASYESSNYFNSRQFFCLALQILLAVTMP